MEDQDCGVCGDSNAERVNEKEYLYKYLCSRCQRDNDPDYCERDFLISKNKPPYEVVF